MAANLEDVANKAFDYVIVGGGTAGLVLAARLSEDSNTSVLVLEAGAANMNDPAILRPVSYGALFGNPAYDWDHCTVSQKHCNGAVFNWPRGKGLGGSSAINFFCWTRPPAEEIDEIEKLGNPGWNWKNYQKYSQKVERFIAPSAEAAKKHDLRVDGWTNGTEGPLITSFPKTIISTELEYQKTLLNLGFTHAKDPLGGDSKGVFFTTQTVDPATHTRSYSTTAYYLPAKGRKNLTVLVNAYCNRILTETAASGSVVGKAVEFTYDGKLQTVNVGKEVILSAGALKSPQILELSGIGKKDVLQKLDIPVKLDLPVGENVQEHVYASISFELRDGIEHDTLDALSDPKVLEEHLNLHEKGEGIFTMGLMGFSFCPLQSYTKRADEIHKAAREKILAKADKYPPGLLEQYEIQLDRLSRAAPGCETHMMAYEKLNLAVNA
ncbi:hypothetical protein EW146_g10019 [Bondarzewia mesenterica]|uniref:Glucose-methanol-choline oxidoreductase N-terminal domain-containing protein n=1 Tax=Bondarzewia mesenterica TaxID=1095465 RepID=A0A4V3XC98_9AGAM|nr:hypothetical protein EW146_g10019 [Bondarzewia mesenterica]